MNRVRRLAAVGTVATLVDVAFLLVAWNLGFGVVAADAVAVAGAMAFSFVLHRTVTFADDPGRRWYQEHLPTYVGALACTFAVDVGVVALLVAWLDPHRWWAVLVVKAPAVMCAFLVRLAAYLRVSYRLVREAQGTRGPALGTVSDVPRLSIVVPAYHEADRIGTTIERLRSEIGSDVGPVEIVVVDDGSADDTAETARRAGADVVLVQPENRGKGAAVRAGMLVATGRTVAFTDADLSYPPAQLRGLLEGVEAGWDVVVGSRRHTETTTLVRARRLRELGGRAINLLTVIVLLGQYRDTQCGLKAFRNDVARRIFSRCHIDGFAFDVEVFHLVERDRLSLTEVPVQVENSTRSTVHVARDAYRLIRDLFRIRRWGRRGAYAPTSQTVPVAEAAR